MRRDLWGETWGDALFDPSHRDHNPFAAALAVTPLLFLGIVMLLLFLTSPPKTFAKHVDHPPIVVTQPTEWFIRCSKQAC